MFRASCRKEAEMLGLDRYFTGKPCNRGHVCERYVSGHCIECHLNTTAAARALRDGAMMKSYRMEMHAKVLL